MNIIDQLGSRMSVSGFMIGVAKHKIKTWLATEMDALGPQGVRHILDKRIALSSLKTPEQWVAYQKQAAQYRGFLMALTDDDFYNCLPAWVRDIVNGTSGGRTWLMGEMAWLRSYMSGGPLNRKA